MKLKELIEACSKNDQKAQNLLYQNFKDILYLVSLKYCRNEADAEDNLHDAFLIIFKNIKKYKHKGSFEGWMKRIVINKAIDKYKKKTLFTNEVKEHLLPDDTTVEIAQSTTISLHQLLTYIQQLPDQYRLVFNLYQLDGFSHKEIATMLSISESTSKSNFFRAKINLRAKILNDTKLNSDN
mgnify:FL=1